MNFGGFKVIIAPSFPKQQLSEEVKVTDAFREKMNQYLHEFFGETCVVEDNKVLQDVENKVLYVNRKTYARLEHEIESGNIRSSLRPVNEVFMQRDWGFKMNTPNSIVRGVCP